MERRGYVAIQGRRTPGEQCHLDILQNEMEWAWEEQEPDTSGLLADILGTDFFEMEVWD